MRTERIARLHAIGIQVWMPRGLAADSMPAAHVEAPPAMPRIRLSAGNGEWLLVTRGPPTERWSQLVEDITGAIGPSHCLFGRWADSDTAGTALDEVGARGIRQVLSLGEPPSDCDWPGLLVAADLETLARDAEARRALWELIEKPLIGARG